MIGSGTLGDPYIIEDVFDLQAMEDNLEAYYELGRDIDASATQFWNPSASLQEHFESGRNTGYHIYGETWIAQTFTPTEDHKVTSVKVYMLRIGLPGTLHIGIRATDAEGKPAAYDLCHGTIGGTSFSEAYFNWREIFLGGGYDLSAGVKYAIVARCPAGSISKCLIWGANSDGDYEGGCKLRSLDSGATWTISADADCYFEEWGIPQEGDGYTGFIPIGQDNWFTGQLDGKGHTISGLYIRRPQLYQALFTAIGEGAVLKNINMTGVDISSSEHHVAALVSYIGEGCEVSNCSSAGSVCGTLEPPYSYGQYVGGLIGHVDGESIISECHSSCTVSWGYEYSGGLIGLTEGAIVADCYSTGVVDCGGEYGGEYIGGLIGISAGGEVSKCHATGPVNARECGGGFTGLVAGCAVSRCYATGDITAFAMAGGFFGIVYEGSQISDCYARGVVSAQAYIGGFAGGNDVEEEYFTNCYSTGAVIAGEPYYVGGFIGRLYSGAGCSNCFWDIETSGQVTSNGGTGKTTAEMKIKSTFIDAGWDFTTIWSICSGVNSDYPCLIGVTPNCVGGAVPTVTTDPATSIEAAIATLNGTLDDDGGEACDCGFEWGETITYGNTTPTQSRTTGQTFAQIITELDPNRTYHFRAFATNAAGTGYGVDRTFKTLTALPIVTTNPATGLGAISATLNGTLDKDGGEACHCGFEWGLDVGYGNFTSTEERRTSETFSQVIGVLQPSTTYHFRAFAYNSRGIAYGADRAFRTEIEAELVQSYFPPELQLLLEE
jgi:hypothetical protein